MDFTPERIMAMKPCLAYTPERLVELFDGRSSLTHHELAALETVPAEDRVWVFLQTEHAAVIVDRIVTRAVSNHALRCGMPEVERWARRWLNGTDRSREAAAIALKAAWARTRTRMDGADRTVATAAWAVEAAWEAAQAAAQAAAWAVLAAAEAAAAAAEAAEIAERKLQIADCLEVINEAEEL